MIIHKYILRNHFLPFIFSIFTLMGVFLLQFMMKFADRLVGKGLDAWLIIQLITYNLSWMLVLVVPMASLVATLMAFGNLSQNNEVTVLKSSGISLYKMMQAPMIAGIVVAGLLFLFNNYVLPDANHQAKILMTDISRKKPTLSLEEGFFSQEVSNYAILVRKINNKTNELRDVTIYDYSNPSEINVVTAKKGKIFFSQDQKNLIMDLQDGEIHESEVRNSTIYRKLVFTKHRIIMDAEQFSFQQSSGVLRGEREMGVDTMQTIVDNYTKEKKENFTKLDNELSKYFFLDSTSVNAYPKVKVQNAKELVYARIIEKMKTAKNKIVGIFRRADYNQHEIEKYEVEIFKKYSIPFACIVFVLIGAPLGIMVRKGGFGVAASISLFFFLLYWAFLIGGEKLAERGFISPFMGMWSANFVIGILGVILIYKTNKEALTLKFNFIKKLIPKRFRFPEVENETA